MGQCLLICQHPGVEGTDSYTECSTQQGNPLIVLGLCDLLYPFWCIVLIDDQNDGVVAAFFCLQNPSECLLEVPLSSAVMNMDIVTADPIQITLGNALVQTTDKSFQGTVSVLLPPFVFALSNEEHFHDVASP